MHGSFHKWLFLSLLLTLLTLPLSANAQSGLSLDMLTVQLWPEFDQPSMLVIYDFTLPQGTTLPVNVTLRIPTEANLIAVAYANNGSLLNVPFQEPQVENNWQVVTITVDTAAAYHIEYYAPLTRQDTQREYTYLWPGDYAVKAFNVSVKMPVDTTEFTTDPQMKDATPANSDQFYLEWGTSDLEAGKQLPIKLSYTKTSDRLSASDQPLQTGVVDENTEGRISLSNYLPYILAGMGILLIVTGGLYFWQTSKGKPGRRLRHRIRDEEPVGGEVYCHQCGKRAQPADRFCRTCGTRLRKET
jgi:hypothetical protein